MTEILSVVLGIPEERKMSKADASVTMWRNGNEPWQM
jgi:hypothetical protein